jgi:hypothetical protein
MRHLYLAFLLALAIVAYGFWPSLFQGAAGPIDPLRAVHGTLAATWMLLLVVQSWLIGHGHWKLHGWFGRASRYIVFLLVVSSFFVVRDMLGPNSHFSRDLRLTLAWIDLWSLLLFSGLYIAAIVYRRKMAVHARLMASTVFVALPPALGRAYGMHIPALHGLAGALPPTFITVELGLAALIAWDAAHRRFLAPYPVTFAGLGLIGLTMFEAPNWPAFIAVARLLGLPPA